MTNYSQRYASGDSNTAGAFYFDTITAVDYPASKVLWGAEGAVNHASAATPLPVSVIAAIPAGTNAIGKLAANSGVDIGDVDVTSIAAGDNNIGNVDIVTVPSDPFGVNADAASATGSISAKLRFIAATGIPITGTVTVGSHAVTNAGTFVVQVDGTALTRLTDIETNTDSLAVVGNGVAATAQRVTLASDSTGVLGATQSGAWTVQPGNTANTTAWLVTGTGGTFPVTGTFWQATQPVSGTVAFSNTTIAVTNAGTFATQSVVTNSGTFAVQIDAGAVTSLALLDDVIFTDDAAFTPGTSKVAAIGLQADETAADSVDEGDVGCPRMTLDRKQIVTDLPHTAGGLTPHKTVSAASTNATVVKNAAGQLYEIFCSSVNAAARYLKLYDKATSPTVGTDTPVWTVLIPGNTAGGGIAKTIPKGLAFANGISFALTTEATDAGTTAVAANEIVVNLGYK